MKRAVFRRYQKHGFSFKNWNDLVNNTGLDDTSKLVCYYCGLELRPYDKNDCSLVVSLDHKIPKRFGGKNELDNLVLCCTKCNIVKGTMKHNTYIKFLELISKDIEWYGTIREELFYGRHANMLSRKNNEEKKNNLVKSDLHLLDFM